MIRQPPIRSVWQPDGSDAVAWGVYAPGHEKENAARRCEFFGGPWLRLRAISGRQDPLYLKRTNVGTEDTSPGGEVQKRKHLEQNGILLIQMGTAHVTLGDKEYDVHAGGTVFFRLRLG